MCYLNIHQDVSFHTHQLRKCYSWPLAWKTSYTLGLYRQRPHPDKDGDEDGHEDRHEDGDGDEDGDRDGGEDGDGGEDADNTIIRSRCECTTSECIKISCVNYSQQLWMHSFPAACITDKPHLHIHVCELHTVDKNFDQQWLHKEWTNAWCSSVPLIL